MYYRDAAAAFVVFDLSRIATFEAAAKWKDDLDMKVEHFFYLTKFANSFLRQFDILFFSLFEGPVESLSTMSNSKWPTNHQFQ